MLGFYGAMERGCESAMVWCESTTVWYDGLMRRSGTTVWYDGLMRRSDATV